MSICVVVADSSKARILLAESGHGALTDDRDFVHPESRFREQDLVTDGTGSEIDSGGYGKHSMGHENAFMTVSPMLTCPSPAIATLPLRRTETMVVPRNCSMV